MVDAVRVSDGPPFGEGPVWCGAEPGPDTLVCTSVSEGALYRVGVATGSSERIADVGGGANGAAAASDGGFLVAQNGGLDFEAVGLFEDPPPYRPAQPGLQRVAPDGSVSYLTPDVCRAPNDLVVAADGTVYFTDPPPWPLPEVALGRIWAYRPNGHLEVVADRLWYPNGIGIERDGTLVVVENGLMGEPHFGLLRVRPDGDRELFAAQTGDGFCLDVDGRFYVAGGIHGVTVLEPDGSVTDVLALPGRGVTTNCCFGGRDRRTLYATDAVPGGVWAWESMPTAGLEMHAWPIPERSAHPSARR
jgi:gluconolactonase